MYPKYIKRILDLVLSILITPIVLPVIGICALLIKFEDGGPVFYCGNRLGKNGRIFKMYKLRSMKVNASDIRNADGSTFNSENDSRLMRFGRVFRETSIDELPQVLNVLFGNMSFIGPRPDLPEHIHYYKNDEVRKLEVYPGISGYNQAYFRNSAEWKHRLKNDLYYVENISFILDVKIIFKTIIGVFFKKSIYSSGEIKRESGVNING